MGWLRSNLNQEKERPRMDFFIRVIVPAVISIIAKDLPVEGISNLTEMEVIPFDLVFRAVRSVLKNAARVPIGLRSSQQIPVTNKRKCQHHDNASWAEAWKKFDREK
jgi:hypothetical protein